MYNWSGMLLATILLVRNPLSSRSCYWDMWPPEEGGGLHCIRIAANTWMDGGFLYWPDLQLAPLGPSGVHSGTRSLLTVWFCCVSGCATSCAEPWHRRCAYGVTYAKVLHTHFGRYGVAAWVPVCHSNTVFCTCHMPHAELHIPNMLAPSHVCESRGVSGVVAFWHHAANSMLKI
jgi:hypothetical protein